MYVVDDKYVNHLVEIDEVGAVVVLVGRHILRRELFGLHIQNGLLWVQTLGFQSYGMAEMRFPQSRATVDDQGVERAFARIFSYFETSRTRQTVAFALDEVVEGVVLVELRVDLQFLQPGDDEGVDRPFRKPLRGRLADGVLREAAVGARQGGGALPVGAVDNHLVIQLAFLADETLDDRLQQVDVVLLKIFHEEIGRHFDGERVVDQREGHDALKPCRIALLCDVIFNHRQAPVPYFHMVVRHRNYL